MSYYKATPRPAGMVNNVEVRCSGCGANLYVDPSKAKNTSGWECPHCGKRH